jgi:hypothetical protein
MIKIKSKDVNCKINTTLDYLYDELDKSYIIKKELNFDTQLGQLICNETRIKLLKDFICVFKLLRKKSNENVLKLLNTITKRIKLHISQLKRSECNKLILEDNKLYFTTLLRVAYNLRLSICY